MERNYAAHTRRRFSPRRYNVEDCTHEEADTRIILHVHLSSQSGYYRVMIRTTDKDVLTLAVSKMKEIDVDEVWIAFATGKHFRYLAIHDIASHLGPRLFQCCMSEEVDIVLLWQRQKICVGYLECLPSNNRCVS